MNKTTRTCIVVLIGFAALASPIWYVIHFEAFVFVLALIGGLTGIFSVLLYLVEKLIEWVNYGE